MEASSQSPRRNLGQNAFIGTVTQGDETHIGLGALQGTLIVGATLVGYDPTPDNIGKLVSVTSRGRSRREGGARPEGAGLSQIGIALDLYRQLHEAGLTLHHAVTDCHSDGGIFLSRAIF